MCCASRQPNRPPPLVEDVEDIRFAEVDFDGTAPRALPVVPLEVAIDPLARHLERHALRGPSSHQIERWSGDADQMSVVLPTEIGFNVSTEIGDRRSSIDGFY
jgi:hypothetical protein